MNDICLHIYEYKCDECGFTWTHSEPIMRTEDSGYIDLASPTEFAKWMRRRIRITCYQRRKLATPICHKCFNYSLIEGWPPQEKDVPHVKRKELSDEALNRLLRP